MARKDVRMCKDIAYSRSKSPGPAGNPVEGDKRFLSEVESGIRLIPMPSGPGRHPQ